MKRNPKHKGSSFERKACGMLSLWASGGTREDLYWRTAMSGGRATAAVRSPVQQAGDITAVHPKGQFLLDLFCVECKNVHCCNWHYPLYNLGTSHGLNIIVWWRKVKDETKKQRKIRGGLSVGIPFPLLLVKEYRRPEVVGVCSYGRELLDSCAMKPLRWRMSLQRIDMHVLMLGEFFTRVDPKQMRRHARSLR